MNVLELRDTDTGEFPTYAWPGGYAIAYVMADGEFLCAKCMNTETEVHFAPDDNDQWRVAGYQSADCHDAGEDAWICAHCNDVIDPAID